MHYGKFASNFVEHCNNADRGSIKFWKLAIFPQ